MVDKTDEGRCRVQVGGTQEQMERAKAMVRELVAEQDGNVLAAASSAGGDDVASDLMEFPVSVTGRIIGTRGASIAEVRSQSGAKVSVEKGEDCCKVQIAGTPSQIRKARAMVSALAEESAAPPRRTAEAEDQMEVPLNLVGRVIGKGGESIQRLQKETGARIDVNT